jgi:hypothetical protein
MTTGDLERSRFELCISRVAPVELGVTVASQLLDQLEDRAKAA